MKNLFGEEINENKYFEEIKLSKSKDTIKSEFRRMHGHKKGCYCKDCNFFLSERYHNKNYFKCIKMGVSNSEATDIRKSDVACRLYKESEDK